ncbi:serine hydrolase domain-containing protein [Bacteroidota bacterium]
MKKIAIIIISVLVTGCLKSDPLHLPFSSFEAIDMNDGLSVTGPAAENIDSLKLAAAYELAYSDPDLWSLRSLLVFRNNSLVSEAYLQDADDINRQHLIWSSTKQVMGILTGIAVDQEIISSIDDPISRYLPSETADHPDKAGITIRQLLTMHSGIDFNNDGLGGETFQLLAQIPDNMTEFILARPMRNEPGTDFYYNDGDPHLLSAVIQAAVGKPTDEWADEVLFSKIGMSNYSWIRYKDGTTKGGYGIESTPREIAKIALCVANKGSYGGEQIVSSTWVDEMITPVAEAYWGYMFGFYWWIDTSRDIHFMAGHGGQFAFIVPSQSLIIVMSSIPNTQGAYQVIPDEAMVIVDEIIRACN